MLVGYMRVSASDERQSVDLQRDALLGAGIDERHLHHDRASGARDDRPGLKSCMGTIIPDALLAHVAPLPWSHIALTGDYLWNEIDRPLERSRPIRANRFDPKNFVAP